MDFQGVVDSIDAMACVVSVEKLADGSCGKLRIVTGNRAYVDTIENPVEGMQMLTTEFVPNSEYTRYMTRDLNFEDFCFRSAVQKKCLHSYAHPERLNAWFDMTFLPLGPDDGSLCYCAYIMEVNFQPSSERLSNVSGELASAVLETCLTLSGSRDFAATMGTVIKDVRELCGAEYCCILLTDPRTRTCTVLCDDMAEGSGLSPMESYLDDDFYEIAESWEDAIGGSNCLIAKNAHDMAVVKERSPRWHQTLVDADIRNIVLFPLKSHSELLGYIWAVNFDAENAGMIKETLELTTFVLGSEIGTYLSIGMLKAMSSRDLLTGVLNRNEMNRTVDSLGIGEGEQEVSVGVIFTDLNSLKMVNDMDGHSAGDKLLMSAATSLREVFGEGEVFRAGGDEFVMILTGITEEELARKTAALREAAQRHGKAAFAIGSCFERDSRNIRRALRLADERMYEDKRAYYERFPDQKRV